MSVFFRTGEHSGVSVSWPVYLFGVLPLQMLIGRARGRAAGARPRRKRAARCVNGRPSLVDFGDF